MRLSIIMPFYNKEERVVRLSIESVLAQTERDLELICVNDASPGSSGEFLYEMAKNDERLKVITHEVNQGVSAARNTALAAAQGDYIGFVDADDMVAPNYYEVMLQCAEASGADIVSSTFKRIEYEDSAAEKVVFNGRMSNKEYYCFKARSIWNRIYKREILQGIKFVPELKIYEDLVFLNMAISRAEHLCEIDFAGYLYRHCNPEIFKTPPPVQTEKITEYIPVFPWHFAQHNLALEKISEIAGSNCNLKTAKAMNYLVLRRFFRIALQMRKFDPATRDLSYSGLSDFFYEKLFPVCKQSFPLTCFLACKIFKHKSYRKSFIYKLQILRLLVELKLF